MFGFAYSAGLVSKFLTDFGIAFNAHSSPACPSVYAHGLRAVLAEVDGKRIFMSIQTCPPVAGPAFAETAIMSDDKSCIGCKKLGYNVFDAVIRHSSPTNLFDHIKKVQDELATDDSLIKTLLEGGDKEPENDDDDDE
jgi:hypothetical protein